MKQYILLVLLLLPVYSSAQTAEPLQEWYHINSGGQITVRGPLSYLPNLVSPNGEHGTVMPVITATQSHTPLWLHRYMMDTATMYEWPWVTQNIIQVDLDNNGVLDYFVNGAVIRGTQNGQPPEGDTVRWYRPWFLSVEPYTVIDVNDDSYPDIITNLATANIGGSRLFSVLRGGSDLANLKYTLFQRRGAEYFIGLLNRRGEDGSFRVVTMSYDEYHNGVKKWTSLVLNEMKTEMVGDSLHISLRTLDSISLNTIETGLSWGEFQSGIYRSHPSAPEYLLITKYLNGNQAWTMAYNLEHDRFDGVAEVKTDNGRLHIINADVNGDGYNDWITRDYNYLYVYAGLREGIDTVPFGSYRLPCTDQIDFIHAIGDVNNDGINDMAYALLPNAGVQGCFGIILGAARRTVGVVEPVAGYPPTSYRMNQNYPNPVGAERRTTIPVEVDKAQQFSLELWGLDGRFIGRLFEGMLPPGQHDLHVTLGSYTLSAGLYVLRLTASEGTIERAILLQ